jgi:hypothetical protein
MGDVLHQGPFLAAQTPLRTRRLQTTGWLSQRARRKFELRRAFSGERARREQKALGTKPGVSCREAVLTSSAAMLL